MKRYIKLFAVLMTIVALFAIIGIITCSKDNPMSIKAATTETITPKTTTATVEAKPAVEIHTIPTQSADSIILSDEEINLIALVTMAEAEGESELGKRLVIDTILNRMDSEYFPYNAVDVIYQPNQFESMWNGRVDRCYVTDDICRLVKEECLQRNNSDVVFFCACSFSDYGTPLFQVGNHYFSSI